MRRSLLTALLVLLAAALMAHGAAPRGSDDSAALAAAQQEIASLRARVSELSQTVDQQRADLDAARSQLNTNVANQKRAAPLIRDAVTGVLDKLKSELSGAFGNAGDAATALRKAEDAARAADVEVVRTRSAIERAVVDERKAFEDSEEFKRVMADVQSAQAALTKEQARLESSARTDPVLGPLTRETAHAEAAVVAARKRYPINDAELSTASQRWMNAKNKLAKAQEEAWSKDQPFTQARQTLLTASAARTDLLDAFERDAMKRPAVRAAQEAYRDAQAAALSNGGAIEKAKADLAMAQQAVQVSQDKVQAVSILVTDPNSGLSSPQ